MRGDAPCLLPAFSSSGCLAPAEVAPRLFNKGDKCFPRSLPSPPALSYSSLPR